MSSPILDAQDKISEALHILGCLMLATGGLQKDQMNPIATTLQCARERLWAADELLDADRKERDLG